MEANKTKEQAFQLAVSALESGLGYKLEEIKGGLFKSDKIARARRIFCQQLRDEGFKFREISQILHMRNSKAQLYTWRKKQIEHKDTYQREKKRFDLALKRICERDDQTIR